MAVLEPACGVGLVTVRVIVAPVGGVPESPGGLPSGGAVTVSPLQPAKTSTRASISRYLVCTNLFMSNPRPPSSHPASHRVARGFHQSHPPHWKQKSSGKRVRPDTLVPARVSPNTSTTT